MNAHISPADLAKIRNKFTELDQDGLFDLAEENTANTGSEVRKRSTPSVRFANCPHHQHPEDALTGVVREGSTEVFRPHNKTIGNGRRILCSGSGQPAPPSPEVNL